MKKLLLLAAMAVFTTVSETSCKKTDDAKFCWECLKDMSDASKGYADAGCNLSTSEFNNSKPTDNMGNFLNPTTQCRKK